ncbi:MAG: EamA family transporter, partial [Alcaligenaceae bacterium]|nr:EamA family transporter [Alcaligenaceae bacterium]
WLLRHYLASRLGVLSFLTPLFAVILGVVLLGERVDAFFAIGAACVVLGIILVNRTVKPADR